MEPLIFLAAIAATLFAIAVVQTRTGRHLTLAGISRNLGLFLILGLGAVTMVAMSTGPMRPEALLLVTIFVGGAVLGAWWWVREFVYLMGLPDDAFPGRHDKPLWFLVLLVLPPFGLVAFTIFRHAYWPAAKPERAGDLGEAV